MMDQFQSYTHWLRGYDVAQQTCPFRMFMEQCDCTCNSTSNPKGCQASDVHWYHELCIKNIWQKRCLKFIERHYHIPSSWNRWGSLCPDIRLLLGTGESSVSPFAPERQSFPAAGTLPVTRLGIYQAQAGHYGVAGATESAPGST